MAIGSSWKIEPTIERQGKQQRKRQPCADLLISGHKLFTFAFMWKCGILNFLFHIFKLQAKKIPWRRISCFVE
jgi:hypothetical protein